MLLLNNDLKIILNKDLKLILKGNFFLKKKYKTIGVIIALNGVRIVRIGETNIL